ncbi:transposase family protein [Enterococcus faecium]|uniref:transposase family protein n=1 Tax=Enterococcus faecium TaxID=1352 RepID=UPI003F7560CE
MSHTQLIKDTLNILDLNIYFEENCLTKEKYKGQICLIYKGTLLYKPEECSHCLCVVPSRIIRWGTTTVRLLLNDVSEYRTYLELKKQRFKCKSLKHSRSRIPLLLKNTVSLVKKFVGLSLLA